MRALALYSKGQRFEPQGRRFFIPKKPASSTCGHYISVPIWCGLKGGGMCLTALDYSFQIIFMVLIIWLIVYFQFLHYIYKKDMKPFLIDCELECPIMF